jgi:cell division protein FtsB
MKSLWGQGSKYLRVSRRPIDISPKLAKLLLILILLMISIIFISGNVGLWNLWRAQNEIKDLHARINMLEEKNALLSVEIGRLENDPYSIEKILREKYGYIRDGDKVYRLTPFSSDDRTALEYPTFLDTDSEKP